MKHKQLFVNGQPIDYSGLPEHMQDGMRLYMENAIQPGGFMLAVLSNDLRGACEKADSINKHKLFDFISWLYNYAPRNSWGSPENVDKWLSDE